VTKRKNNNLQNTA